jgi:hypothetical protein
VEALYLLASIEQGDDQEPIFLAKNRQSFDQMKGGVVFSKINLRSGYHQLQIQEEYIPNNTFKTRFRQYEFTILPFRLTNSPGKFLGIS